MNENEIQLCQEITADIKHIFTLPEVNDKIYSSIADNTSLYTEKFVSLPSNERLEFARFVARQNEQTIEVVRMYDSRVKRRETIILTGKAVAAVVVVAIPVVLISKTLIKARH